LTANPQLSAPLSSPNSPPHSPSTGSTETLADLEAGVPFAARHIGPGPADEARMREVVLGAAAAADLDALADRVVPPAIRMDRALRLEPGRSEPEVIAELRALAARNTVLAPMIGLGYYGTHTPAVIRRNVLESPAWYTAYTPYQPEISQGRLEALLNFQTVVSDLTGLATSSASMLDEATSAAEAMTLMRRTSKAAADAVLVVEADIFPQTLAVVQTRAEPLGLRVVVADLSDAVDSASTCPVRSG
jgi:glycine dehydrogenase